MKHKLNETDLLEIGFEKKLMVGTGWLVIYKFNV